MKRHLLAFAFSLAAVFAAFAEVVALRPGANPCPVGKVLAIEAVTAYATPTVKVQQVESVSLYTNAFEDVVSTHTAYSFSLTNWNGVASVSTNVLDRFTLSDWIVNGTNHVVGAVYESRVSVTNTVACARLPSATYVVTNSLFSTAASNHRLAATPAQTTYLMGNGTLILSGVEPEDSVFILVE